MVWWFGSLGWSELGNSWVWVLRGVRSAGGLTGAEGFNGLAQTTQESLGGTGGLGHTSHYPTSSLGLFMQHRVPGAAGGEPQFPGTFQLSARIMFATNPLDKASQMPKQSQQRRTFAKSLDAGSRELVGAITAVDPP